MRHRPLPILAGIIVLISLLTLAAIFWHANRALQSSTLQTAREGQLDWTANFLDPAIPPGFDTIAAPDGFRAAALFHNHLFLAGGAGLFQYDSEGRLLHRFRTGLELPAAPITALASSPEHLWIATSGEGILTYDGNRFQHIRPGQPKHRKVNAILPLSTGRTLLGTEQGVLAYDTEHLTPLHPSLADTNVTALAGSEPSLWIGTQDSGALHFHAGQLDRYNEPEGLPDPHVFSIATTESAAYIATALGVAEVIDAKVTRVLARGFTVRSILPTAAELLAGTLDEGLLRIPLAARNRPAAAERTGCDDCTILQLLPNNGEPLALTSNAVYRTGTRSTEWSPLLASDDAVLADRNIAALSPDPAGRLWIGYFDRGLDIYTPNSPRAEHIEDNVIFCVNRIVHDPPRDRTAVATANGLVLFNRTAQRHTLTRANGLIASHVTDVLARPDGTLIAGTPAGVSFIEPARISSIYAFHGLVNNHVYALAQTANRTWVGTLGGLSVIESGLAAARFTTSNSGFKHNWITALIAADPHLLAGTYGGGIMHLTAGGTWEPFPDLPKNFEVNPNAMAASPRAIYAGTLARGLAVFDRNNSRWRWVTAGLPSINVTAVAVQSGIVYIGTDNGLVRVQEEALVR
jgi:ligand-binding sensor domain-containing protein